MVNETDSELGFSRGFFRFFQQEAKEYFSTTEREKFYPGPGFEPGLQF